MGLTDLDVDSGDGYVELAVELGTNAKRREAVSESILAKCSVLYEDAAEVRDFERFLLMAAGR
jgi:predicted O-linked N-acetylglucosamine transferase (SPINDLY family)